MNFLGIDAFDLLVRALVLFTAIPVHEAAHAYIANKMGDPTGRYMGRMTLNPIAHFDPVGSLAMLITGIGWAKPVPINPNNFDDRKKGMALSAAAGPISNIIMAAISLAAAKIIMLVGFRFGASTITTTLFEVFWLMTSINLSLAVFNLIPIPPFDGSRIFNYFLPDKYYFKIMEYERYIFLILLFVLFTGILELPLGILTNLLFRVIDKLTNIVSVIFRVILL